MITVPTKDIVENSVILGKCVEHAIHIMRLVDGKEDMFALAKVFLCGLFLGVGEIEMTQGEKTSKLKEIKETVSGEIEIMRQIRSPGVQESFGNIIDTANITKEIIESL